MSKKQKKTEILEKTNVLSDMTAKTNLLSDTIDKTQLLSNMISKGKWQKKSGLITCKFDDFTYYFLDHLVGEISQRTHPELKTLLEHIESYFHKPDPFGRRLDAFATTGISHIAAIFKNESDEQLPGIGQASVLMWNDAKSKKQKQYPIASSAMDIYEDEPSKIDFVGNLEIGRIERFTKARHKYPASPCTILMACNFFVISDQQKKMPVKIVQLDNMGGPRGCLCYMKAAAANNFQTFIQTKPKTQKVIISKLLKKEKVPQLKNISLISACDYFEEKTVELTNMYFVLIS